MKVRFASLDKPIHKPGKSDHTNLKNEFDLNAFMKSIPELDVIQEIDRVALANPTTLSYPENFKNSEYKNVFSDKINASLKKFNAQFPNGATLKQIYNNLFSDEHVHYELLITKQFINALEKIRLPFWPKVKPSAFYADDKKITDISLYLGQALMAPWFFAESKLSETRFLTSFNDYGLGFLKSKAAFLEDIIRDRLNNMVLSKQKPAQPTNN